MLNFRSLRTKVVAVVLMTTFCALLVAGGIILFYDINDYRAARVQDMSTQIELLAYSSAPALQFDDQEVANENLDLLQMRDTVNAAAIYDERGRLFASYSRGDAEGVFPGLPGEEGVSIEGADMVIFRRIIVDGVILGTAYMRIDYLLQERILNVLGILGVVAFGSMLVAVLVSLWLQRAITRPLRSIARIARAVTSENDYSRRGVKQSDDEVGVLVEATNAMLDEIESRTKALQSSNLQLEQEAVERHHAREEVLRLNQQLEQKVSERTQQLETTNQELESFCYSVSHDLRAPLRSISGFSQALREDLPDELPGDSVRYLDKITAATQRMGQLIDDLLNLSRVSRGELGRRAFDLSEMARQVIHELEQRDPERQVDVSVWDGMKVEADPKLLRIVLENLLDNAWKFTSKRADAKVEIGFIRDGASELYFVRDNGAGFDMQYADKLFGAFQRLHGVKEYPGTGIGLATVQRIINRHGGRIWADSTPGNGTVFYFTLQHSRPLDADQPLQLPDERDEADTAPRLRSV